MEYSTIRLTHEFANKSEAFKYAWAVAKSMVRKPKRCYGVVLTMTVRDYFNLVIGDCLRHLNKCLKGEFVEEVRQLTKIEKFYGRYGHHIDN